MTNYENVLSTTHYQKVAFLLINVSSTNYKCL